MSSSVGCSEVVLGRSCRWLWIALGQKYTLERASSSGKPGLFLSGRAVLIHFWCKDPFPGLGYHPPNPLPHQSCWDCAEKHLSSWECWGTNLAEVIQFLALINGVVHQGTITWPPARHIPGISSGEDTWNPAAAGRRVSIRGSSLFPTTVAGPEEAHSQPSHTAACG